MDIASLLTLLVAVAVGAALGWLAARARAARLVAEQAGLLAERNLLRERLSAADRAADRGQDLAVTVAPLREALSKVETHLRELEGARVSAYAGLTAQVSLARETSAALHDQTAALVNALRAPQARGRWGEMQLRRVVELAGMVEHCDFDEQASVSTSSGVIRPDLVVRMAGGKHVVVDAKVTLSAYLQAAESRDPDVVESRLRAHARHLREHVNGLAAKEYWRAFEPTPEFVVLFVPGDAFLAPALEHDPSLLEDAMARRVLVATPTTLMAMLRTVAYTWQQEALTEHARSVFELGRELYRRLGTLGGHVDKLGRTLGRAVEDYNRTVGSLERNVLAQARRMADLQVTDAALDAPPLIDELPRHLSAPELLAAADRPVPTVDELVDDLAGEHGPESQGGPRPRLRRAQ